MRDNFSMLPIVQDMNCMGVRSLASLSSNGYYGYQPLSQKEHHVQPCLMEVQFESRKRCWEQSEEPREFKKRRQDTESSPQQQSSTTSNRDVKLRKPTHNIPDMPRCIMGHYI